MLDLIYTLPALIGQIFESWPKKRAGQIRAKKIGQKLKLEKFYRNFPEEYINICQGDLKRGKESKIFRLHQIFARKPKKKKIFFKKFLVEHILSC